jgi:hypothetical protein
VTTPLDFLRVVVLNEQSHLFEAWLAGRLSGRAGVCQQRGGHAAAAGPPGERAGGGADQLARGAGHPVPMALWAALLMGLTVLGMATALLGLVVVVPWLAHASWHAYRDLVSTAGLDATTGLSHVRLHRRADRHLRPDLRGQRLHAVHGVHHLPAGA